MKQLARRSALSMRAQNGQIVVLDTLSFDEPKTKAMIEVMKNLNVAGKKALFVLPENNVNVIKSARNIERTNVTTVNELNTYAVMNANVVIFTEDAVNGLEGIFNA